jgi:hypothetical protein
MQKLILAEFSLANPGTNTKNSELFALMAYYDFWDKPGKPLGFDSVKQSLLALLISTKQLSAEKRTK